MLDSISFFDHSFLVLSTLLITPDGYIMLDCGEGAYGQLTRRFGANTMLALMNIKCIFISHGHADHHLGLINLLRKRKSVSCSIPLA